MDSIPQRAREGGAVMPREGRYSAKSQGRRCGYVQGKGGAEKQAAAI